MHNYHPYIINRIQPNWYRGYPDRKIILYTCDMERNKHMMTNQKYAGSIKTTWQLHTYDVWGNAKDGYQVNDKYDAGEVELWLAVWRYNVGVEWHVCRNSQCPGNHPCGHTPPCPDGHPRESHGVLPVMRAPADGQNGAPEVPHCPECDALVMLESQEFKGAHPSDRQIKRALGVPCRIQTDGDDVYIAVDRARDGYPIGELTCVSHESLSPVRKAQA